MPFGSATRADVRRRGAAPAARRDDHLDFPVVELGDDVAIVPILWVRAQVAHRGTRGKEVAPRGGATTPGLEDEITLQVAQNDGWRYRANELTDWLFQLTLIHIVSLDTLIMAM